MHKQFTIGRTELCIVVIFFTIVLQGIASKPKCVASKSTEKYEFLTKQLKLFNFNLHTVTTLFISVLKGVKYLILDFVPVKLTSLVLYTYQSESRRYHYYLKLHAHIWAKRAWSRKFKFQMSNFTTGGLI